MATVFNLSEGRESARDLSAVIAERSADNLNRLAQMTNEEQRRAGLSPTALHEENMKAQEEKAKADAEAARLEMERKQKMIRNTAAEEIFSRKVSEQVQAKVDPSTIIKAAIPGNAQWQIDDKNDFVMQLKDGTIFSGGDLVKSVYATKDVVANMLGEGHAAIFDRAFVAPLDPNFRLQKSAKDAVAPFIGEMQKNGSFSPNYTEENIGIVQGSIDMGIVEKALRYSLERLQDGDNPAPTAVDAMSMVADSKGFGDYPDAAKKYVLETVAEKIDLLSNNLTSKVGADVSALFNSIDQEVTTAIAGMGVDFDPQELMPVSLHERAGLVREITATRDTVHKNQSFLIANEGVLSVPWADRKVKEQYQATNADNDKMKQRLAELYKKATRDIPQDAADPVGAALFGIGASAVEWGADPEKVEKELGGLSQNFAAMNASDQRKFLAERLVNNWYAANSKDPSKAPINAAIRTKMLETIKSGQKLAPEIEDSLNTTIQNFRTIQSQQRVEKLVKAAQEDFPVFQSMAQYGMYRYKDGKKGDVTVSLDKASASDIPKIEASILEMYAGLPELQKTALDMFRKDVESRNKKSLTKKLLVQSTGTVPQQSTNGASRTGTPTRTSELLSKTTGKVVGYKFSDGTVEMLN